VVISVILLLFHLIILVFETAKLIHKFADLLVLAHAPLLILSRQRPELHGLALQLAVPVGGSRDLGLEGEDCLHLGFDVGLQLSDDDLLLFNQSDGL
jgi:hypothetical protein